MNSLVTLSSSCLVCVGLCVCVCVCVCRTVCVCVCLLLVVSASTSEKHPDGRGRWIQPFVAMASETWLGISSLLLVQVRIVMDRVLCEAYRRRTVCVCWKSCSSVFVSVVCWWRTTRCVRVDGRLAQCGFLRWSTKRRSSQGKYGCFLGTLVLVVVVCVRGATRGCSRRLA